jgi:hypothetical protein
VSRFHILEVSRSNLGPAILTDVFFGFLQFLDVNAEINIYNRPGQFPSTTFPIHYTVIPPPNVAVKCLTYKVSGSNLGTATAYSDWKCSMFSFGYAKQKPGQYLETDFLSNSKQKNAHNHPTGRRFTT